jgi:iron(III) transport system ATP-binding protein
MDVAVSLTALGKSFGAVRVLSGVDLNVASGSFTSLLGPSGCGKTTLLNMIGGLERPSEGEIRLGRDLVYSGRQSVNLPTERRNVGYVFQSYALWPHMTVLQNVGYPLKIRRLPKEERDKRSREILDKLELGTLADRYPFQLSGGQQQRVAIARSIVYRPRLLLLDEPLSNLDAQLRERARAWLRQVHESFGLTTILVTHDRSEALSLSDQVVLLNKGEISQVGTAHEVYEQPRTAYAAEFVGGANIIPGRLSANGRALETQAGITIILRPEREIAPGAPASVAIRPSKVRLINGAVASYDNGTLIPFAIRTVLYQGANYEIVGDTPLGQFRILSEKAPQEGDTQIILPIDECSCVRP